MMDVKKRNPKNTNYTKRKRDSYSCSYNVYESVRYEHIKAINHYSYTSPVKAKVLNLYNNKNANSNGQQMDASVEDSNPNFSIHQLVPNTGPAHGGIQVTIYGQGFYDGLYVVYGNCIIETEFIDENTITFYLPPNPKCFHYNGKKTVVEDLFVVDLYKSLISHAEFNTNISDSFNIMLEIIMKIVVTRVCNNFNDLSFRKSDGQPNTNSDNINPPTPPFASTTTSNLPFINGISQKLSTQKPLGININLFNTENNGLLNSLKSIQNSISCSLTQQEKAFSSLLNKTKGFIPTFYISNHQTTPQNSQTPLPSNTPLSNQNIPVSVTASNHPSVIPVININIPSTIVYDQPQPISQFQKPISYHSQYTTPSLPLNVQAISINGKIINTSSQYPYSSISSPLPTNYYCKSYHPPRTWNKNSFRSSSRSSSYSYSQVHPSKQYSTQSLSPSSSPSLSPIHDSTISSIDSPTFPNVTTDLSLSQFHSQQNSDIWPAECEEMAVEGDDEMEEDEPNALTSTNPSHLSPSNTSSIEIIPKANTMPSHFYQKEIRKPSSSSESPSSTTVHSRKTRVQSEKPQTQAQKREQCQQYLEGKKIERVLEECIKKANETQTIQPNEFLYFSTTSSKPDPSPHSSPLMSSSLFSIPNTKTLISSIKLKSKNISSSWMAKTPEATDTTNMSSQDLSMESNDSIPLTPESVESTEDDEGISSPDHLEIGNSANTNKSSSSSKSSQQYKQSQNNEHGKGGTSKRSITVKITLIHLGIILCMTRLIYYILKYCKLCSRVQDYAEDVSTKIHDICNPIKKKEPSSNSSSSPSSSSSTSTTSSSSNTSFCLFPSVEVSNPSTSTTIPISSNPDLCPSPPAVPYGEKSELNTPEAPPYASLTSSPFMTSSSLDPEKRETHTPSSSTLSSSQSSSPTKTKTKSKRRANYLKIIDQGDTIGNTPLHYAIIAHSPILFNMLIEAGANINKENMYGQTVLDLAYAIGDDTMVELIEDHMNSSEDSEASEIELEEEEDIEVQALNSSPSLVDSGFSSGMNEGYY